MRAKGHIPVRTCISCGKKRPKMDLIRLIPDNENHLVRDDSGRIKGRAAYVCHGQPCIEQLFLSKRLNRHFRTEGNILITREFIVMPFNNK